MAKYLVHVPVAQYGFISSELEGNAQDAVEAYKTLQLAWNLPEGLGVSGKEFNIFLDTYLTTGKPGELQVWELMSMTQKTVINEVKKCLKRINK